MSGPPDRTTCPRCFALLRRTVRWRGMVPVSVGFVCVTNGCGFSAVGAPWFVGVA